MKALTILALLSLLCLVLGPLVAEASNNRTQCCNNLLQIYLAMLAYSDRYGVLPTDICDGKGNPLLSWRLRVLPYLDEGPLFRDFHLDESWDSPHNQGLIREGPSIYICPSSKSAGRDRTCYMRIVGRNSPMLVEVDDSHSVIWSKPEDWIIDPANPGAGLGYRHFTQPPCLRSSLAIFPHGACHLIPVSSNQILLRTIFSENINRDTSLGLPWLRAIVSSPLRFIMIPWFLLCAFGAAGVLAVALRMIKRLPISPGELLWFIVGTEQITQLIAVVCGYKYEPFPAAPGGPSPFSDQWYDYWFLPCLVGTISSVVALMWYRTVPRWRLFFLSSVILFGVLCLDARIPHEQRSPDESFITAVSPFLLGCIGIAAAIMSSKLSDKSAWLNHRIAHWTGILLCVLPLIIYFTCIVTGLAPARELFTRNWDVIF